MKLENYLSEKLDKKWQKIWEENNLYKTDEKPKRKFYCLDMFPYPSGKGLHVGHLRGYIASDIISRFYRMRGYSVLHPMGFDAFGLPAENAAIKFGVHPKEWTYNNIKTMTNQLKKLGCMYDWERTIATCEPIYYKFTQWIFIQLYKAGLVKRENTYVNWCDSCKTVLANEQVIKGKCERCDNYVYQKTIEQWVFKITEFAEDLLKGLNKVDWPESTVELQKNWIGKSEGWQIVFDVKVDSKEFRDTIEIFTTRLDTIFGVSFLAISPDHPLLARIQNIIENLSEVQNYIVASKMKKEVERLEAAGEKTGVELKGVKAINPVNGKEVPIFVADYVLMTYATGAVMGVPAHDQRDFDFAKKYGLEVVQVVQDREGKVNVKDRAFEEYGVLINSDKYNGLESQKAIQKIGEDLQKQNRAEPRIYYHLRDWIISRQRYWGAPIPMIYCEKCGWQPVPEEDLPVLLPEIEDFKPTGDGRSPLAKSEEFVNTKCPSCKGPAKRETDTMDTFVDSSWYYFRYTDPKNAKEFASRKEIEKWLPVDFYIGGSEHAVGHLLYSRFITRFLKKKKLISFSEPFLKLKHPGIVLGSDGFKMSKSRGNVVNPDDIIAKYGVDTLRVYEMFMGPLGEGMPWSDKGIEGCYRFLQKVIRIKEKVADINEKECKGWKEILELHKTIKKVTKDIINFKLNTAIASLMNFSNVMWKMEKVPKLYYETFLKLLAPFAPHTTEQLWFEIKGFKEFKKENSIHLQPFPKYDPRLIKEEFLEIPVQINGKLRDVLRVRSDEKDNKIKELALNSEKVKKYIDRKTIKKIIYIKRKLINLVV
ncbi:Leucine--tRNA ligase [bacterium HR34]|nr:Leucine--tRNA ligase [bacterium HR34]